MALKISLGDAIRAINPSAQFSVSNNDFSTIQWIDGTTPISQSDVETKQAELQTASDANQYQRDREKVYPPIGDQLDMQYWDKINATSIWSDLITKIKSDNPKE